MNQKGFVSIILVILVVVIAGTVGYFTLVNKPTLRIETTQPQQRPPSTTNNPRPKSVAPENVSKSYSHDCNLISNSNFRSINQYEVGLGPNGPAMGYWDITLQSGKFQWHHSDAEESGSYTCNDNVLRVKFSDYSITARYDKDRKILTWDSVEYRKVE